MKDDFTVQRIFSAVDSGYFSDVPAIVISEMIALHTDGRLAAVLACTSLPAQLTLAPQLYRF